MNKYIGNELQLYGVEEYQISGGKGDGMRMLLVRNAAGLEFCVSLDRCGDISKLLLKGTNFGYFSPCGYVSPKYYDNKGIGFLKSFTAGFFTTCGLNAVGSPCIDNGEELSMHGSISNTPCENYSHFIENDEIHIKVTVRDASLFADKYLLEREYVCPIYKNKIRLCDTIKNIGSNDSPFEILYHCNMGYPLLSENAKVSIPSSDILPRNEHAKTGIENCLIMEKPQRGYEEKCYYHKMIGKVQVSIKNPDIKKGLIISYDTDELPCFTQWKMMGEYDYVLGLEPGNCYPDGRDVMRKNGMLKILKPNETVKNNIKFDFMEE